MWKGLREAFDGEYGGRLAGLVIGCFAVLVYLFFGFWDMLVSTGIVALGWYVGWKRDKKEVPFLALWNWLIDRRRDFK